MGYTAARARSRRNPLRTARSCSIRCRCLREITARKPPSTARSSIISCISRSAGGEAIPKPTCCSTRTPIPSESAAVLGKYPFKDVLAAYQNLNQLATETIPFLSSRRCRQFLANIAPQLLARGGGDARSRYGAGQSRKGLRVAGGQGGVMGAVQLQHADPEALRRSVPWSRFLSEILINNPGMIDELLDSLVLNLPRASRRCGGADGLVPRAPSIPTRSCTASRTRNSSDRRARHPRQGQHHRDDADPERSGGVDPRADRRAARTASGAPAGLALLCWKGPAAGRRAVT